MDITSQAIPKTKKWVERFARFGYAAKGAIYVIVGVLSAMAAFGGSEGQTTGRSGAFKEIAQQPFGQILLGIVAIGFIGYAVWRFIQAIQDAENKGDDASGIAVRIGYALSGMLYGYFAYYAFQMISGSGGSSSGGGNKFIVGKLLEQPFGQFLVGIFAALIIAKGIYQIHKVTSGSYIKGIKDSQMNDKLQTTYRKLGQFGLIARAVVFGVIGFFLAKAAFAASASKAKGTEGAFDFLVAEGGPIVMGIVAIGLASYGVFEFFKAKYKPFRTD
ncbi:MAG: DUF1206 domain-containing protein [Tunicatimonas sp.]|uniref:DUF1206 domain-containing protein n=1 Tax=Tunicatimonas sp. TaxID=1940096 RepID=UPI003C7189E6